MSAMQWTRCVNRSISSCCSAKNLNGTLLMSDCCWTHLKNEAAQCRKFSTSRLLNDRGHKPIAKVFYLQNPLTWLDNKIKFHALKTKWDPTFDHGEFQQGARQAICTVTTLLSRDEYSSLQGLLTRNAFEKVQQEMQAMDSIKRRCICLSLGDICVDAVRKVNLQIIVDHVHCDVDVAVVGVKKLSHEIHQTEARFLILELIARFHREYTKGVLPEWTITKLIFKRCDFIS